MKRWWTATKIKFALLWEFIKKVFRSKNEKARYLLVRVLDDHHTGNYLFRLRQEKESAAS